MTRLEEILKAALKANLCTLNEALAIAHGMKTVDTLLRDPRVCQELGTKIGALCAAEIENLNAKKP